MIVFNNSALKTIRVHNLRDQGFPRAASDADALGAALPRTIGFCLTYEDAAQLCADLARATPFPILNPQLADALSAIHKAICQRTNAAVEARAAADRQLRDYGAL